MPDPRISTCPVEIIKGGDRRAASDHVAVEEPLEIQVTFGPEGTRVVKPISITMRTPGARPEEDAELATGFLVSEGVVRRRSDVQRTYHCGPETPGHRVQNVIRVELDPAATFDAARLDRHFYTTSSCGVCGKTSLDALRTLSPSPLTDDLAINSDMIHALPELLRAAQSVFDTTGGLHAAALFNRNAHLLTMREDVGRHNALDKLIGSHFLADSFPLANRILLLSGRASFELLQKSVMASIPIVAAVGAPSSLAVDLARQFNITLLGFVRNNRFNVYAGGQRLLPHGNDFSPSVNGPATISNAESSHG